LSERQRCISPDRASQAPKSGFFPDFARLKARHRPLLGCREGRPAAVGPRLPETLFAVAAGQEYNTLQGGVREGSRCVHSSWRSRSVAVGLCR